MDGIWSGMVKVSDANFEFQKVIAIVGVSLMAIKFFAYYLTGSVAILTDALESIVNVIAAFVGLFALYLSAQPADRSHPFGHGKVEIISAAIEATMIMVAGGMIIYESIMSFLNPGERFFVPFLMAILPTRKFTRAANATRTNPMSRSEISPGLRNDIIDS